MPGINEIILVVVLAMALFFLAKKSGRRPEMKSVFSLKEKMGGRKRLTVFVSIIWSIFMAVYIEPWNNNALHFIYFGILPVAVVWGIAWVIDGYKK